MKEITNSKVHSTAYIGDGSILFHCTVGAWSRIHPDSTLSRVDVGSQVSSLGPVHLEALYDRIEIPARSFILTGWPGYGNPVTVWGWPRRGRIIYRVKPGCWSVYTLGQARRTAKTHYHKSDESGLNADLLRATTLQFLDYAESLIKLRIREEWL